MQAVVAANHASSLLAPCKRALQSFRWVAWLLAALFCMGSVAAQTVQYLYDETGRLVGTVAPDGRSAYYSYDAAGNITATRRVNAGTIDLAEFTPNSGAIGSSVTLWGSGFSATPNLNTVRFNGTTATVTSASVNKLVVTVPAGATTGPVAVTSPAGTVTSSSVFTVVANTGAPTISSFTPAMGPAGTAVAITGTRFDPTPGATRVEFNGRPASVSSVTATRIDALAPVGSGGRIRVATVGGSVTSATDFLTLPSGINAADVLVSKRAVVGAAAQTLNINAVNKVGALLFDGTLGQYVTLNFTAFTTNPSLVNVSFQVYAPNGELVQSATISSSGVRSFHLPVLTQSGTYTIYFKPGNATANLSANLRADGLLATNGTELNSSVASAGQSVRVRFTGTAGKDWAMNISNVVMSGTSPMLYYSIKKPDGGSLGGNYCYPNGNSCSKQSYNLPVTGTYTVEITPNPAGSTGTFTVKSWESTRVAGTMAVGTSKTFTSTVPGQVVQHTFNGTTGQQLGLALSDFTTSVSGATLSVVVLKPDSSTLLSTTISASSTVPTPMVRDLPVLPETGTYTVQVYPPTSSYDNSPITTFSGQVLLSQDVAATLATNGTASNINIAQPGQTARLSFTGTAGKDWAMNISNVVMSGTSPMLYYSIKKPDGGSLGGNYCYPNGNSCSKQSYNLPVTGTYTVEITPNPAGSTGTFTVKSWESTRVAGTMAVGTSKTFTSTVPGQVVQNTFAGSAGQQLGLSLSNFTTSISGATLSVVVLNPDNSVLSSMTVTSSNTAPTPYVRDLPVLPTTGTYLVQVYPYASAADSSPITTFSGQALLSQDVAATLATNGTASNITIAQPGQTARLSFTGTAGKDWVMSISNMVMSGSNPALSYRIKKPDGTSLTSSTCYPTGMYCSKQSYNLPVTGTYTIEITPSPVDSTGTFTVKSWESTRVAGTMAVGTSKTFASTVPGQVVQHTFNGTTGQQLGLALSNFTTSVSAATLSVVVLNPDGSTLTSTSITASSTAPTPTVRDLPVLPATGTYTVQVYPYASAADSSPITTFSGQALLSQDVAATLAVNGTARNITITHPGQTARLSFTGTAGKDWVMNISNMAMSGSNPTLYYRIKKPDGTSLGSNTCYPTGNYCSKQSYNLPVTGTYTIEITPSPVDSTGTFTVKSWQSTRVAGTMAVGTSKTFTSTVPGQVVQHTFNGTTGQQLGLTLSNFTTSVTSATLSVVVLNPDGSTLTSTSITASSTAPTPTVRDLPVLPATGTYTVQVYPYASAADSSPITTFSGQALLSQDVAATLAVNGTARNITITHPGQTARLNFTGTAGKDWVMNVSNMVMSGSNPTLSYRVKKPDGSTLISTNNCYANGTYCSRQSYNLPVTGTYTIEITPSPVDSTGTFTVKSWESTRVTGALTLGANKTLTSTVPGQMVQNTFTGTTGQLLRLTLSNFTTSVSGATLYVTVLKPDGSTLTVASFTAANTTPTPRVLDLAALPTDGTYTVQVNPYVSASDSSPITTFSGQALLNTR